MTRRSTAHRKLARPSMPRPAGPRMAYPSDLTDPQWRRSSPSCPPRPARVGRAPPTCAVVNAILYLLHEGCHWLALPHDFPSPGTVRDSFDRWLRDGTLRQLHDALRDRTRVAAERDPQPTAAAIDSPSVQTTEAGGTKGFDAGKKVKGRKRHHLVDRLGLLPAVVVHSAGVQDCRGADLVLKDLENSDPNLKVVWADGGFQRDCLLKWVKERGVGWRLEVVQRPPGTKGFSVPSERWLVEWTFAWLGRCRRLSKDDERQTETSEALIRLAMIYLMVRRLEPAFQNPPASPVGGPDVARVA